MSQTLSASPPKPALDFYASAGDMTSPGTFAGLIAELPDLGSEALVNGLVDRLKSARKVAADARTAALAGYEPKLSQGERRLKGELAQAIKEGGFSPPDATDLTAKAGGRASVLPELLALLAAEERVVEVGPGLYLDFDAAAELRRRVAGHLSGDATMTMADIFHGHSAVLAAVGG